MSFWENVKTEIKRAKTTQEWVAIKAKISFRTFQGWISKNRLPDVVQGVKIAEALEVSAEELVNGPKTVKTISLQNKAEKYLSVLNDLEELDDSSFRAFATSIHNMAEEARARKKMIGG